MKNKLLLPTLSVVFPLMASPPSEDDEFDDEDEEDDEVEEGTEASRPCAVASQVKYEQELSFMVFVQRCGCQKLSLYSKVSN